MAYLVGDVAPVLLASELLQVLLQKSSHLDDTVSHALDFTEPLLVELGVVHDGRGNAGAVDWGVRVKRADEDFDLRIDALLLFGGLADNGECTDTLAIETL